LVSSRNFPRYDFKIIAWFQIYKPTGNMRISIIIFFVLNYSLRVYCQGAESSGTVYYIHKIGELSENYELKFKRLESVYSHHVEGKAIVRPDGSEIFSLKRYYDWFLDSKTNEATHYEKLKDGTLVFSVYPAVNLEWELKDETKEILGYKVQKAISRKHHFNKGDPPNGDAEAWFAIDIPCNSGPERFWGLPGLILELRFTSNNSNYSATKIVLESVDLSKPTGGIKVPKDQLVKRDGMDKKWLKNARELLNNDN
jgi:GLPGLI family protein